MVLTVIAFAILAALTPAGSWGAFAADAAVVAIVLGVARVEAGQVARQLRLLVPFLLAYLIMAVVSGGPRVRPFEGRPLLDAVTFSVEGSSAALTLTARSLLGAGAGLLLLTTLTHSELLGSLRRLRFPDLVVEIIGFVLRYGDLLSDRFDRRSVAMASRGYRRRDGLGPLAASTATLFVRSFEQGERVEAAMQARGYAGRLPTGLLDLETPVDRDKRRARRVAPLLVVTAAGALLMATR